MPLKITLYTTTEDYEQKPINKFATLLVVQEIVKNWLAEKNYKYQEQEHSEGIRFTLNDGRGFDLHQPEGFTYTELDLWSNPIDGIFVINFSSALEKKFNCEGMTVTSLIPNYELPMIWGERQVKLPNGLWIRPLPLAPKTISIYMSTDQLLKGSEAEPYQTWRNQLLTLPEALPVVTINQKVEPATHTINQMLNTPRKPSRKALETKDPILFGKWVKANEFVQAERQNQEKSIEKKLKVEQINALWNKAYKKFDLGNPNKSDRDKYLKRIKLLGQQGSS